jgi:2-oxoglutarate ferredoxin oxidoreductase subunit delta
MRAGKVKINRELCKGCSYCVISCPKGVLEIEARINKTGYFPAGVKDGGLCTGCAICALMCPEIAVTVWREEN